MCGFGSELDDVKKKLLKCMREVRLYGIHNTLYRLNRLCVCGRPTHIAYCLWITTKNATYCFIKGVEFSLL